MPNSRAAAVEGESTRLIGRFTLSGVLTNPLSLEDVNIYSEDPTKNPSAIAVTTITPTLLTTGRWYVDYTFTSPGVYFDKWRWINAEGLEATEAVETVTVNTLPTDTAQDWSLLATWVTYKNTIQQAISANMAVANTKDGSLSVDYDGYAKRLDKELRRVCLEIMRRDPSKSMITPMVRTGMDDNT